MINAKPLLIVFTDELGSTARDLMLLKDLKNKKSTVAEFKEKLNKSRTSLFSHQIENLGNHGRKWTIIKTVGDSLIISLDAENDDDLRLITDLCLGSLFKIWKESPVDQRIRIACHLTSSAEIITGKNELKEIANCFATKKDHLDLVPVLRSIHTDIFGPAMNKAARLASIPKCSLFVVSQELMEFKLGKTNIQKRIKDNESSDLCIKIEVNELTVRAHPIPIVNLKGFEACPDVNTDDIKEKHCIYSINEIEKLSPYLLPWYIWEIEEINTVNNYTENMLPLRVQYKEMQSLKIVACKFGDEAEVEQAKNIFENSRLAPNPCKLFVDSVFEISKTCSLYMPNPFRVFKDYRADDDGWVDAQDRYSIKTFQFLYIMFTSVPDLKTDSLLRKYFTPNKNGWDLLHISYDIYEGAIYSDVVLFDDNKITLVSEANKQNGACNYLLLFQIKHDYLDSAENWNDFFNNKKRLLNTYRNCHSIGYGLLRGEFDGYVLFSAAKDSLSELKEIILNGMNNSGSFFYKIAPIFLFELSLKHISDKNIEFLKEVRKRYDASNI